MRLRNLLLLAAPESVGGQAVIEGVMMRAKDRLAIAVRRPDGEIHVEVRPWFSLTRAPFLRKPFVRGFPVLLETLVNGIKALNFSATQAVDEETDGEITGFHLALTMIVAVGAALGLFVVLPHFFSLAMEWVGLSGDVSALSFHIWDGLFKLALFVGYILAISYVPDIRRVFQYHGAEHKVIWTFESGGLLTPESTRPFSRLHPRCGTAFLLFVLAVSIVLYTFLVPWLLTFYSPSVFLVKHLYIVALKLLLMVPVSCLAYEMIKFAGRYRDNGLCKILCWPGLAMQMLTTKEPDDRQIEVAIAALKGAVGERSAC
ncbi:DUF1385 domain-containing protein [Desulfovibrio aminophilus]|nr:DUF1385 domain-containing protein [Desulfovibrio aminophilus]